MQNLKRHTAASLALFSVPLFTFAAQVSDFKSLVSYLISILNALIPLFLAVAMVGFIWGVIRYMYSVNSKNMAEARNFIIYSVIALTVMISIWSLAIVIKNTFFPDSLTPFRAEDQAPSLQTTSQSTQTQNTNSVPVGGYDSYGNPTGSARTGSVETTCVKTGNGNSNFFETLFHDIFGGC